MKSGFSPHLCARWRTAPLWPSAAATAHSSAAAGGPGQCTEEPPEKPWDKSSEMHMVISGDIVNYDSNPSIRSMMENSWNID